MFEAGDDITHSTAKAVLKAGLKRIADGETHLDCRPLVRFDSSALAVMLAWQRAALKRGHELHVSGVPAGLESLARAYGVDGLAFGYMVQ